MGRMEQSRALPQNWAMPVWAFEGRSELWGKGRTSQWGLGGLWGHFQTGHRLPAPSTLQHSPLHLAGAQLSTADDRQDSNCSQRGHGMINKTSTSQKSKGTRKQNKTSVISQSYRKITLSFFPEVSKESFRSQGVLTMGSDFQARQMVEASDYLTEEAWDPLSGTSAPPWKRVGAQPPYTLEHRCQQPRSVVSSPPAFPTNFRGVRNVGQLH